MPEFWHGEGRISPLGGVGLWQKPAAGSALALHTYQIQQSVEPAGIADTERRADMNLLLCALSFNGAAAV